MAETGATGPAGAGAQLATSKYRAALAVIVLAGLALRAFRLGAQIIIDDEWHALNVVHDAGYGFIFSHFGHADYSIPMALYFEWLSHGPGLSEWSMRLPSLAAGVATIALAPLAMRRWLSRGETLLMAALIAISPLLINFSRTARPYAVLALLIGIAIPYAWLWWRHGGAGKAAVWVGAAVASAWLHPLTMVISTAPFLWFGGEALIAAHRRRDWRGLRRLFAIGAPMALLIGSLLAVPLHNDWGSLLVKANSHQADARTLVIAWSLLAGSGNLPVLLGLALGAIVGWLVLRRRDPDFAVFTLMLVAVAAVAVLSTGAAWINHALVLARYLIGLLPLLLALMALGITAMVTSIGARMGRPAAVGWIVHPLALLLIVGLGPVPDWYRHYNQFTGHLSYQFDFDPRRNLIAGLLEALPVPEFYAEIAAAHPDRGALVVEAPWHLESFWNPLYRFQLVHRQRVAIGFVNGVCAEPFYGELAAGRGQLEFDNFVSLEEVVSGTVAADYLILRRSGVPDARELPVDIDRCIAFAANRLGEPWRESAAAVVFKIPAATAENRPDP